MVKIINLLKPGSLNTLLISKFNKNCKIHPRDKLSRELIIPGINYPRNKIMVKNINLQKPLNTLLIRKPNKIFKIHPRDKLSRE